LQLVGINLDKLPGGDFFFRTHCALPGKTSCFE
jgi:hypothetical protein